MFRYMFRYSFMNIETYSNMTIVLNPITSSKELFPIRCYNETKRKNSIKKVKLHRATIGCYLKIQKIARLHFLIEQGNKLNEIEKNLQYEGTEIFSLRHPFQIYPAEPLRYLATGDTICHKLVRCL